MWAACAAAVCAKGITIRFLASPPEDSIVRYAVLRGNIPGMPPDTVGKVPALPARDTLVFADSTAARGRAYVYSIIGLTAEGGASDPSESTLVALPSLSLPDTVRADSLGARLVLSAAADPLSGSGEPLSLSMEDTARFSLEYDPVTRTALIRGRHGADAGWAVLSAGYFGKFRDRDSVWLILPGPAPVGARARAGTAAPPPDFALPSRWSPPAQGPLRLGSLPGGGRLQVLTMRGETVAELELPFAGTTADWDGRDGRGRPLKPACYLWAARGPRGVMLRSGSIRLEP
jgi:hypothetical protein